SAAWGPTHTNTLRAQFNLAKTQQMTGQPDQAFKQLQQAASSVEMTKFEGNMARPIVNELSQMYEQRSDFEPAEAQRKKWLIAQRARGQFDSWGYTEDLELLVANLNQQRKWAESESLLRQSLVIQEKKEPDLWKTFGSRSLLGEILLGQKKY